MIKLTKESDILDIGFRAVVLESLMNDPEIRARKLEHEKRYEVFKDRTREFALRLVKDEMGAETALEMQHRVPNISITKKIIKKKARVYKDVANRTIIMEAVDATPQQDATPEPIAKPTPDPAATLTAPIVATVPVPPKPKTPAKPKPGAPVPQLILDSPEYQKLQTLLDAYVEYLKLDSKMKKVNEAVELHLNVLVEILPAESKDPRERYPAIPQTKKGLKLAILRPQRFDVLQDPTDPDEPLVVIKSYIDIGQGFLQDYRAAESLASPVARNEGTEIQTKAMPSGDDNTKRRFVWWSPSYHFTTDAQGTILNVGEGKTPTDNKNPFGELPYINFSKDQTEGFWSDGGEGLAGNAILLNLLIGDLNYGAKYQSTGLGWYRGKNAMGTKYVGPTRFMELLYEEGEPVPEVGFASANPALDHQMQVIEQLLGFFLTSEDLEPGSITSKLTATNAKSGIQEIIQKSEPVANIEDQQQLYKDREPELIEKALRIAKIYEANKTLCDDLASAGPIPDDLDYDLTFQSPQMQLTENERVDIVIKKKSTGMYTEEMLLRELHPDLDDAGIERLQALLANERATKMATAQAAMGAPKLGPDGKPLPAGAAGGAGAEPAPPNTVQDGLPPKD